MLACLPKASAGRFLGNNSNQNTFSNLIDRLLFKNKINGEHKEDKSNDVIQFDRFVFEECQRKDHKNDEGDNFLDYLKLH